MRVFRVHGVLARAARDDAADAGSSTSPWCKPLVGRMLGYGHFVFESAAQEQGLRDIRYVGRPDERDLAIQRVVQRAGLRGPRVVELMSAHRSRLPFDPIDEAARQWARRWDAACPRCTR